MGDRVYFQVNNKTAFNANIKLFFIKQTYS